MQRLRRDPRLADRIARVRTRAGGKPTAPPGPPARPRRISRRERERQRQRQVLWGIAGVAALVLLILGGGALYEFVLKPNATLASVGDVDISRRDYWKARAAGLIAEANELQQIATSGFVAPEQQQQYLQLAQQRLAEVGRVWGTTETDEATLRRMIDDQVYLQRLDSLGLSLSDQEVEQYTLNQFAPPGSPLITPTPTPTFVPARAALATETAATATAAAATPATPEAAIAAAIASPSPDAAGLPAPTPSPAVAASPAAPPPASPGASPAATPVVSPTPNAEQARATAEAGYAEFRESVFEQAHLTPDDYARLVARPAVARQKVADAIAAEIGQTAEQVRAAHILVETRDLTDELAGRLASGEDFATLAREVSIDEATAANGGELGWFVREEMVPPFADAAFGLEPGVTSQPVETEFGWHLIRVEERSPDRPLTAEQIAAIERARVDRWLEEQRAALAIDADLEPTPTASAAEFQPPAQAPPPPTPTPEPPTTPAASPATPLPEPPPAG